MLYEVTLKRRDKITKVSIGTLTVHCPGTDGDKAYWNALANLKSFQEKQTWEICGLQSIREA